MITTDEDGSRRGRLERLLHQGLAAQQRGDQAEAERLYLTVLAAVPEEPNANNLLAVLRLHQGAFARGPDPDRQGIGREVRKRPSSMPITA